MYIREEPTQKVPPREAVRLVYTSKSRLGSGWLSPPHIPACSEMIYCTAGQGQFRIGDTQHTVRPDDLLIINPQIPHTEQGEPGSTLEYVVLGIEGVEFLVDQGEKGYTILPCQSRREELRCLMGVLLRESERRTADGEVICQDLLEVLLLLLVRMTSVSLQLTRVSAKSKECAAAKRYLDENFRQNISLDQLAAVAHINKYYLAHAFQKEYNISPINYLLRRRIRESKALLAGSDYSLSQISAMVGFSSPSYFSQSFRRLEGISPIEYRRASQKDPLPRAE